MDESDSATGDLVQDSSAGSEQGAGRKREGMSCLPGFHSYPSAVDEQLEKNRDKTWSVGL